MTKPNPSAVIGRWRISEIEGWDTDYIDMLGPGYIQFDCNGGQIEFGALQISLDCWYGVAGAQFNFRGSDEGTEVDGDGDAEIEEDGLLHGELRFHNGDDMPFTARGDGEASEAI